MKFFTRKWWSETCTEAGDDTFERYSAYIESIRDRLTVGLVELVDRVSLHDARVTSFKITSKTCNARLLLDGFDWAARTTGQPAPARIALAYTGLIQVVIRGGARRCHAWFQNADLGYNEIELVGRNAFEHRMLFDSGQELVLRFKDIEVRMKPAAQGRQRSGSTFA
jgi:hypothetical protein